MYRKSNIVTTVKLRRLKGGGHLVRMSDDMTVKKVFLGKPDGRRKAGKPKLRRLGCIQYDLKSMVVKRWRKKAEDRILPF
jgi:heterodisulfide reductase subunit A-like polyferredoxin